MLQQPIEQVYERALSAADAFKKARLKESDEAARRVELKVGMTMKSWGERVVVELTADDESTTTAQVSSRASVGTTMVDYGKNHDNVERVKAWLSEGPPPA
jgi:hypothetical protein